MSTAPDPRADGAAAQAAATAAPAGPAADPAGVPEHIRQALGGADTTDVRPSRLRHLLIGAVVVLIGLAGIAAAAGLLPVSLP